MKNLKVKLREQEKPTCSFLLSKQFEEMICSGYTPLSKNPEVLAAVDSIAGLISSMTIYLMGNSKNGDKRIKNSLSRLLDIQPSLFMTRKTFIFNIVKEMLLTGNAVAIPSYTSEGYIESLDPIGSDSVSFIPRGAGYYMLINGAQYEPDEVLHFPNNTKQPYPWLGNSYKVNLRTVVNTLAQASETKKGFMESKWKPSLIIKADAMTDSFGNPISRSEILNDYIKANRAGEPWLIPSDTFEVQEVKPLSLNDLAVNDSVELDKKTVASVIGVPPFVVGVGAFNKDEWNNFINTKIRQICNILEQEFTRKLILKPEWYVKFNSRSLYAYNISELSTVGANLYTKGIMTGNEVRDWTNQDPKDGLDELVILENYIPQGMIGDQKKLNGGEDTAASDS